MNRLVIGCFAAVGFAATTAALAEGPSNLDELLEQVKQSQTDTSKLNKQREREFLRAKNKRKDLVEEAQDEFKATEKKARSLRKQLDKEEAEIKRLQAELDEQAGDLRELFSVARSVAGDLQARLADSLTALDGDDKAEQVAAIANKQGVLGSEELRSLWFLLQQEATEVGKVKQLRTEVVAPDGKSQSQSVVRVGAFSAFSEDGFLRYQDGRLELLGRQPSSGAVSDANDLAAASSGYSNVLVDPTRGSILGLLVESPTLIERVQQGGVVGYVILALGAIGLLIAAVRLVVLTLLGGKITAQAKRPEQPDTGNALGRILSVFKTEDATDTETLELKLDDAILREVPALERGQTTLKLLAAVAPLLGLLGTVTGMIITFQSITLFGTGDPKLMAGGISQALVTTVLGLVVAIPLLFAHSFLASRSRGLIQVLEQQSAGLLARVVEKNQRPAAE
jgi:biopolymer transport protein ExbB